MKVCFVTHDSSHDIAGPSSWLRGLLPVLQMTGLEPEVHMVAIGARPSVNYAFFKDQGIPVHWVPFLTYAPYAVRMAHAVRSLLRLLKESRPDIYVPNGIVPAYYAGGYARRAGIPTVGVVHNDDLYNRAQVDEFINGDPDFRISAVVPVSTFLESQVSSMAEALGVMVRKIGYGVSNPVKTAELSASVFRLVYLGRLNEAQKRVSDVANALCTVTQKIPNLEAWIVGDGEARPAVEAILRQKGVGARVRLLGWVDNSQIYEVLAQCHALVLLSDYEGLPVAILEAMAAGVVPICLDARSGIREVIENGVSGLIVNDRTDDFVAKVKCLQSDPAKWRRLSFAARKTVKQNYSIEECSRQWVDLLEHLQRRAPSKAELPAFGMLRLPPPNPRYGALFSKNQIWKLKAKDYVKSVPPLRRLALRTLEAGRKVKRAGFTAWIKK